MKVEIDSCGIKFCPVDHRGSFWCVLMLGKPVSCGLGDERLLPWNSYDTIDDKGIWIADMVFSCIFQSQASPWIECIVECGAVKYFNYNHWSYFPWPPKKQPQPLKSRAWRASNPFDFASWKGLCILMSHWVPSLPRLTSDFCKFKHTNLQLNQSKSNYKIGKTCHWIHPLRFFFVDCWEG